MTGGDLDFGELANIANDLEESDLPYKVDLSLLAGRLQPRRPGKQRRTTRLVAHADHVSFCLVGLESVEDPAERGGVPSVGDVNNHH